MTTSGSFPGSQELQFELNARSSESPFAERVSKPLSKDQSDSNGFLHLLGQASLQVSGFCLILLCLPATVLIGMGFAIDEIIAKHRGLPSSANEIASLDWETSRDG
jgi:hypothetical protein